MIRRLCDKKRPAFHGFLDKQNDDTCPQTWPRGEADESRTVISALISIAKSGRVIFV